MADQMEETKKEQLCEKLLLVFEKGCHAAHAFISDHAAKRQEFCPSYLFLPKLIKASPARKETTDAKPVRTI